VLGVTGDGILMPGRHDPEHELVHVLRAEKHVVAVVERALHHGHLGQPVTGLAGGIVDLVLSGGHGGCVLVEGDQLLLARGPEKQQLPKVSGLGAVAVVDAELETTTKVIEERIVRLAIIVAHVAELGVNLLLHATGDGTELRVLLQGLARDVERDVGAVHDPAHEVVVVGQEVGALLLDEDVGGVEREPLLVVLAVEVEGLGTRDEEERIVAERTLGMKREGTCRRLEVMEGGLVELVVVLLLDLRGTLLPDGGHGVEGLELLVALVLGLVVIARILGLGLLTALGDHHPDGVVHVVRVLLHKVTELPLGEELVRVILGRGLAQEERDGGAVVAHGGSLVLGRGRDRISPHAIRLPGEGLFRTIGAADHADLGGNHEAGVEANAKASDDVHVGALVLGVLLLELLGAGMRDGAEVLVELGLGHAHAVVAHRDGACVLVKRQAYGQLVIVELDVRIGEAHEGELVDGVGGVGHELSQEDLLVGVDRVDHEVEELLALRLELLHGAVLPF